MLNVPMSLRVFAKTTPTVDGGSKVRRGAAEFCSAGSVKVSLGNGLCRGMLRGDVQRPRRFRLASLRR